MLAHWSDIGTCQMNGGAFSWSNIWDGARRIGSTFKSWGSRLWNSSTGQALRAQLRDTGLQQKVVEGLSEGIHGAVDLARQEVDRELRRRLEKRPTVAVLEDEPEAAAVPVAVAGPAAVPVPSALPPAVEAAAGPAVVGALPPPPAYSATDPNPVAVPTRPAGDIVFGTDGPRSLVTTNTSVAAGPPAPLLASQQGLVDIPVTQPGRPFSPAVQQRQRIVASLPVTTVTRRRNWQGTLDSIMGMGVHAIKRRRCY